MDEGSVLVSIWHFKAEGDWDTATYSGTEFTLMNSISKRTGKAYSKITSTDFFLGRIIYAIFYIYYIYIKINLKTK